MKYVNRAVARPGGLCPWCSLGRYRWNHSTNEWVWCGGQTALDAGKGKWEKNGRIYSGNRRRGQVVRVNEKRWKIVRVLVDHRPGFWSNWSKPDWGNYIACAHKFHEER